VDSHCSTAPRRRPCFWEASLPPYSFDLQLIRLKDSPPPTPSSHRGLFALAGRQLTQDERCQQCHRAGGAAKPIGAGRPRRDPEWLAGHVADPEVIAPGMRPAPPGGMDEGQIRAILDYVQTLRAGATIPEADPEVETAARVFALSCSLCHRIDGEDGTFGPDLTHIGHQRDALWLREWISNPSGFDRDDTVAAMPGFGDRLSDVEIDAISNYLSRRK
jgi:mono/diheme cytochrome c family protein